MARAGVDVGGGGGIGVARFRQRQAAQALGPIHQQPGLAGVLPQHLGHRRDRHHLAGVPEQVGEHHKFCAGRQRRLQPLQHGRGGGGFAAAQIPHRQLPQLQPLAAGQLPAGGHHARMFAVADQQLIARPPGQTPEGQHAAAGYVLGEGQPLGGHAAPAAQPLAQFGANALQIGPHITGERAQLLNLAPGGHNRLQGGLRQGPLAAVVEVGLVSQGGQLAAKGDRLGQCLCCDW